MTRQQLMKEVNGMGFADLEENFRLALLEEIQSGYELLSYDEAKMYFDKCWFEKEAIPNLGVTTNEWFIPRKYL